MTIKIAFQNRTAKSAKGGAMAVAVEEGRKLGPAAQALDEAAAGALSRALKLSRFNGKKKELLHVVAPDGLDADIIYLFGTGRVGKDGGGMSDLDWQALGGKLLKHANGLGLGAVGIEDEAGEEAAVNMAEGALLASYRFDKYRTKEKADAKPTVKKVTIRSDAATAARRRFTARQAVSEGVFLTRDLVSEPPNVLYPESFAKICEDLAEFGLKVEVLGEKKMAKLGMNTLLGVGQGSTRESKLVVMRWDGGAKNARPIAFVGKGVTFDTGGISLKPGPGMEEMKWDMGGAGVVTGLMKALAGRKAKVNAVGVIGLVENMPDGNAQRPGDVVTSMSGQTVEIHNTDAEGRLVLADALWYTAERFKPKSMIDLATLTGAIIVSLGHEHAGLFSNSDDLSEKLTAAGLATDEKLWRLPLAEAYNNLLKSDCADMKNIGGRWAGSITAAQFLKRFVKDTDWAHLDIAGVAWSHKESPTVPKGGTGFGVRLLDRYVKDNFG